MALSTMTASDVLSIMEDFEDLRSKLSRLELRAMDALRTEAVRMIGAHMTAAFQVTEEAEQQQKAEEVQEKSASEDLLRRFDLGFEKWLRQLSEQELERVVRLVMEGHQHEQDCKNYVGCVHSMEHMVKNCTKCKRNGCERCSYVHSLRYVVRWQKPGEWWKRTGQSAVLGAVRFLQAL